MAITKARAARARPFLGRNEPAARGWPIVRASFILILLGNAAAPQLSTNRLVVRDKKGSGSLDLDALQGPAAVLHLGLDGDDGLAARAAHLDLEVGASVRPFILDVAVRRPAGRHG